MCVQRPPRKPSFLTYAQDPWTRVLTPDYAFTTCVINLPPYTCLCFRPFPTSPSMCNCGGGARRAARARTARASITAAAAPAVVRRPVAVSSTAGLPPSSSFAPQYAAVAAVPLRTVVPLRTAVPRTVVPRPAVPLRAAVPRPGAHVRLALKPASAVAAPLPSRVPPTSRPFSNGLGGMVHRPILRMHAALRGRPSAPAPVPAPKPVVEAGAAGAASGVVSA